jgi:predicted dehydrogenase
LSTPIRMGVVGCGLIAQVMHLPYLRELSDRYEIAALCDIDESLARRLAEIYGTPSVHSRWQDLLGEPLDAVMVLTSGDHSPVAVQAAAAGLHVFVEKPMSLSSAGAEQMREAARSAGVRLMVGTMKRYDPAYERLAELLPDIRQELRLARVTTLESPFRPYVDHYPLLTGDGVDEAVLSELRELDDQAVDSALGQADEQTRWCYRWILLDNLVHEFNALRGVLGEPTEVVSAQLTERCVSVNLRFGESDCHLSWVDLPGIARYRQEFAFYAPDQRFTLELPSPFLRSMPSRLFVEGGRSGTSHSWVREEIVSYDEAFKRELVEFADCVQSGREPRTSASDGLADIRLCEAVARVNQGVEANLALDGAATGGVGGRT